MITLVAAIVAATVPNGTYLTEDGSALVRVEPCGSSICGRITDILNRDPAVPRTDTNNPDPRLKKRPLAGLGILGGFSWDGRQWANGRIYDPRTGRIYRSKLSVASDGSLAVSGCVLFICQTQRWHRASAKPAP